MNQNLRRFSLFLILILPLFLNARHNARVKPYPERKIFSYEIQGDTHWLGMGKGIVKYDAITDSAEQITEAAGYELGIVKDIAVADSNLVWFVVNDTLLLTYDGKSWHDYTEELNQISTGEVDKISVDEFGALWAVMDSNLIKHENDEWKAISRKVPLKNRVTDMILNKGVFWVRSWNELGAYKNGKWKTHELNQVHNDESIVRDFRTNPANDLIILNNNGLYTVSLKGYISLGIKKKTDLLERVNSFMIGEVGDIWYTVDRFHYANEFVMKTTKGYYSTYPKSGKRDLKYKIGKKLLKDDSNTIWVITENELFKYRNDVFELVSIWADPLDQLLDSDGQYFDLQNPGRDDWGIAGEGKIIDNQEEGYWSYQLWTWDGCDSEYSYTYKSGNFKNGLKIGEWQTYYSSGAVKSFETFKDGYRDGLSIQFTKEGEIESLGNYNKNRKSSVWIDINNEEKTFAVTEYKYGKKNGYSRVFFPNGCRKKANFSNDEIVGNWEFRNIRKDLIYSEKFPDFVKTPDLKVGELKNGKRVTIMNSKFQPITDIEKALFYRVAMYKDDLPVGVVKDFYMNGTLLLEGKLLSEFPDVYDGTIRFFDIKGDIKGEQNYSKGLKNGKCLIFLSNRFKPVRCYESSKYYRVADYKEGKPMGIVRDYFLNGTLQFEGKLLSEFPSKYEGIIKIYDSKGMLKSVRDFDNGKKIASYMEKGKNKLPAEANHKSLKWTGDYVNGKRDGAWILTENAKQLSFRYYIDGVYQKPLEAGKMLPQNYLRFLRYYEFHPVVVEITNSGKWKLRDHLEYLMTKIKSKKKVSVVVRPDCQNWPKGKTSTEGREAMYMIEGFIQGVYPPTESSFTDFDPDPEYYQKWWKEYKKR